jgi:hypothetical protein
MLLIGGNQLRLNLGTASLLSLIFIIEAAAMAGIIAGAIGLVQIPVVDPKVAAIIVAGVGSVLAFFILYKSHA